MKEKIKQKLLDYTKFRFEQAKDKRLIDVYQSNKDFVSLVDGFVSFCYSNKTEIGEVISDIKFRQEFVELCNRNVKIFNTNSNQFLENPKDFDSNLNSIYESLIDDLSQVMLVSKSKEDFKGNYEFVLKSHLNKFKNLIEANIAKKPENEAMYFSEKVCSEYSPELQIEILGIDVKSLKQPVLDIGCGSSANLVEYLREKEIQAIGIDKIVHPKPYLFSYSWDEFPFPEKYFGTIISHMSFSNHFVYQHNCSNGEPEKYARVFMKILNSLKAGGSFFYTPDVPFFEEYLPAEKYHIQLNEISNMNVKSIQIKRIC